MHKNKFVWAFPAPWDKTTDYFSCEWLKVNPTVFENKNYPICPRCNQKYVPIHGKNDICFRCK